MFLDFYGLNAQPFGVTPDPRYLYFSPGHREALASLFYGIETGRGFLALIAAPGMGKTTLLFQLVERLKRSARCVFLFQTQCDSREILHYISDGLGLDRCDNDSARMHAQLNKFLLRKAKAGRRVVLFIDEAQNLSDSVLETVRLLSDFEATDRKLLQIVLAGQPEVAHRLLHPGLAQLRQRIAVLSHLRPLPAEEIPHYINHRLQVAGYLGPELFTPKALALIAKRSQGVPRIINNICFSAMSLGFATGHKKIEGHTVREAIRDLWLDSYAEPTAALSRVPAGLAMPRFFSAAKESNRRRDIEHAISQLLQQPARRHSGSDSRSLALPFVGNWLKGPFIRTALLTASLLVALVSGLVYLAGFSSRGHARPPKIQEQAAITEKAPHGDSLSPVAESSVVQPEAGGLPSQTAVRRNSPFTHVVQPRDTLWELSLRMLGRYDPAVLAEIQELNRDLRDPNRLKVGQWLTLPRDPSQGNAPPNSGDVPIQDRSN